MKYIGKTLKCFALVVVCAAPFVIGATLPSSIEDNNETAYKKVFKGKYKIIDSNFENTVDRVKYKNKQYLVYKKYTGKTKYTPFEIYKIEEVKELNLGEIN
ncbi:hypothetical protein [Bacillus toyonensis]|uniref:hypothetical protein n=1 Tax=Bacillus toyonensis TaxID=155322 RepID=UPI002E238AB4|nr:hypothetical protein [Bacillus toyonensis]